VLRSVDSGSARALVVLFVACLVLFFGRATLGQLLDLLPGSKDLFVRRFLVGVQLAGLLLAGIGTAELARTLSDAVRWAARRLAHASGRLIRAAPIVTIMCCVLAALVPAWSFLVDQADRNAAFIARQAAAAPAARSLDALVTKITKSGGGRVFAGDPSDGWGPSFTVGEVPVFKYLASRGVDEVGFTLRTASLMSGPEQEFDETNPADYALFGIRWLLLPPATSPPVPATFVERRRSYALWELPANGYVQVVDTRSSVAASSSTLASFASGFLSTLPVTGAIYPTVAYGSASATPGTLPVTERPSTPAGRVLSEHADLADGTVETTIVAYRTATVLLSASYDPGWQVLVDGRPATAEMVAPALVGVRVGPGEHMVQFTYRGFPDYPQLFALGALALISLLLIERRRVPVATRPDGSPR
jgi:hypothetical protein